MQFGGLITFESRPKWVRQHSFERNPLVLRVWIFGQEVARQIIHFIPYFPKGSMYPYPSGERYDPTYL